MPESAERGALTEAVYYILLSVYKEPLHGYGIAQRVDAMSEGRVALGAGTLYGALNTLVEKGWIVGTGEEPGSRKKEYAVTEAGRRQVHGELLRLEELLRNGRAVVESGAL